MKMAHRFKGGSAKEDAVSPGRDEKNRAGLPLPSPTGLASLQRLVPRVETLGESRQVPVGIRPGVGHHALLELKPRLRALVFIQEEEDQTAPALGKPVREQTALAARLGGEYRCVARSDICCGQRSLRVNWFQCLPTRILRKVGHLAFVEEGGGQRFGILKLFG